MERAIGSILAVLALACGGAQTSSQTTASARSPHGDPAAEIDIRKAAMPFHVLARDGSQLDDDAALAALAEADAVCVGEQHTNPHHHWVQLHLLEALSERASERGAELALGLEMVQRPFQAVLDDYARGVIDERALRSRIGWEKRWGYAFSLYRPMLALAAERGHAIIALNVSEELRARIRADGVEGLSAEERAKVPELRLDDEEHRAWFDAIMAGHPGEQHGGSMSGDDIYRMQVLWDETMADTAARWLGGGEGRQIVILAGNGHCHDGAISRRIERRGVRRAVSVRPVMDDGKGSVAEAVAEGRNDFLIVLTMPEPDASGHAAE